MRLRRFIRNLLILLLVAAIFAAVSYYIYLDSQKKRIALGYDLVTQAVSTAIQAFPLLFKKHFTTPPVQPKLTSLITSYSKSVQMMRC